MTSRLLALMLVLAILLCGCGSGSGHGSADRAVVYRVDMSPGGGLVRENAENAAEFTLEALIDAMNSPPTDDESLSSFPEGMKLLSAEINKGTATVSVNSAYLALTKLEKLLAESAIVLSLSALDEVCSVDIVCNGTVMAAGLTVEEIAEADGVCGEYERTLKLYLPDGEGKTLRPESVTRSDDGKLSLAEAMLEEIFDYMGGGMEKTIILSVSVAEGLCRVDLSQEFYGDGSGEDIKGELIIYSIVNSLCRIPGVETVTLTVEGMNVESYGEHTTVWPLEPNMSLVSYQDK